MKKNLYKRSCYLKTLKFIGFVILGIIFLAPLLILLSQFYKNPISNEMEHWGQIGDFIGGVFNPLIALFSLGLLYYITTVVSHLDDKRLRNQFRYEQYKEIANLLDPIKLEDIIDHSKSYISSINYIDSLISKLEFFSENNFFLFREADSAFLERLNQLQNTLKEMSNEIKKLDDYYDGKGERKEGSVKIIGSAKIEFINYYTKEVQDSFNHFSIERSRLKYFIQKVMIDFPIDLKIEKEKLY